jgi:5'-3' exonuclease
VQIHLVDATYELFRAHYAPRPPVRGRDGIVLSGVAGLVWQLLTLLRDEGATHVGCATDHVIESWRNEAYAGYKTSAGMPPELLAQFPIAEEAIRALGLVCWPMVEWEADDALATACRRWSGDQAVERVLICTPDKDMAQLVRGERVVLLDRRRRITYDEPAVVGKWGVPPVSIPDWLALVGDAADGYPGIPGWGAKSAAAVLAVYGALDRIPRHVSEWQVPGLRNAPFLAASLEENEGDVRLYRELARLRTDAPLPERTPAELEWRGAPRREWQAFCRRWGLERLLERPHRWLGAAATG